MEKDPKDIKFLLDLESARIERDTIINQRGDLLRESVDLKSLIEQRKAELAQVTQQKITLATQRNAELDAKALDLQAQQDTLTRQNMELGLSKTGHIEAQNNLATQAAQLKADQQTHADNQDSVNKFRKELELVKYALDSRENDIKQKEAYHAQKEAELDTLHATLKDRESQVLYKEQENKKLADQLSIQTLNNQQNQDILDQKANNLQKDLATLQSNRVALAQQTEVIQQQNEQLSKDKEALKKISDEVNAREAGLEQLSLELQVHDKELRMREKTLLLKQQLNQTTE